MPSAAAISRPAGGKTLERTQTLSYLRTMAITHQTVVDKDGQPTAALIPWKEFELIRERLGEDDLDLSDEWREELRNRVREIDEGQVELVDGDDFLGRLRDV